jgi:signal transduction histidine kinase
VGYPVFVKNIANAFLQISMDGSFFDHVMSYAYSLASLSFIGAMLLLLMLLHLSFHLRFPRDRSNILIVLIQFLMLISCTMFFIPSFLIINAVFDFTAGLLWYYSIIVALHLLPFVIAVIFRLDDLEWSIHLTWFSLIPLITMTFAADFHTAYLFFSAAVLIGFIGFFLYRAYRERKKGVKYIVTGAAGSLMFSISYLLNFQGVIELPLTANYLATAAFYLSMPLGLTFYMASRYGNHYLTLEEQLQQLTSELQAARDQLRQSHQQLKAAQDQLIHQEKFVSLGHLTNSITNGLKKPVNFVNYFSDLSLELIEKARNEMMALKQTTGAGSGTISEEGVPGKVSDSILGVLGEIDANLRKIHKYGSDADHIIKSMYKQSSEASGAMEPTDINALVRETVNLACNGMRTGNDPIEVEIDMKLDEKVGQVPLVAEDFSRAILYLCKNAFEAMREKLKTIEAGGEGLPGKSRYGLKSYTPQLTVSTRRVDRQVFIKLEDNGPGIPDEIKDKIMQPFFTARQNHEGPGLGLSVTHDIIKEHGGEILILSSEKGTSVHIELKGSV